MSKLETGQLLPNFSLPDADGRLAALSAYRRRFNLVVIFSGQPVTPTFTPLLDELAAAQAHLLGRDAAVLAVTTVTPPAGYPFKVLVDADGAVHRQCGAVDDAGKPAFTIAILDRYGEIYARYTELEKSPLPSIQAMIEWLEYIELQCDE
ncbi:MAG: redoxin domain-containing protein [Anaerolineaceae bacterium]|jgi:peroxiredoxin